MFYFYLSFKFQPSRERAANSCAASIARIAARFSPSSPVQSKNLAMATSGDDSSSNLEGKKKIEDINRLSDRFPEIAKEWHPVSSDAPEIAKEWHPVSGDSRN